MQTTQGASRAVARLRYTGNARIVVQGTRSGRSYAFSGSDPERSVDGRDVEGLLRAGVFRRVG